MQVHNQLECIYIPALSIAQDNKFVYPEQTCTINKFGVNVCEIFQSVEGKKELV